MLLTELFLATLSGCLALSWLDASGCSVTWKLTVLGSIGRASALFRAPPRFLLEGDSGPGTCSSLHVSFRPEQGFSSRSEDGFSSRSEDGFSFRPEDGFSFRPEDGFSFRPEEGFSFRPEEGLSLALDGGAELDLKDVSNTLDTSGFRTSCTGAISIRSWQEFWLVYDSQVLPIAVDAITT